MVVSQMPRYDIPRAAPEPFRIVQELVNSVDVEHGVEWLATPADLDAWLRERGLLDGGSPATAADVRRTHELRAALRALLIANGEDEAPPGDAVSCLNAAARRARLTPQLGDVERPVLVPLATGVDAAVGRILAVVLGEIGGDAWPRLKACRNCRWAFWDASRNRTASWCSMQLCGNRRKTRAYRARRRSASSPLS